MSAVIRRLLLAIATMAALAVAAFVAQVWRLARDLDVTPTATPDPDDEEPHGMPTLVPGRPYSLLV